jgi:hypothetical protein
VAREGASGRGGPVMTTTTQRASAVALAIDHGYSPARPETQHRAPWLRTFATTRSPDSRSWASRPRSSRPGASPGSSRSSARRGLRRPRAPRRRGNHGAAARGSCSSTAASRASSPPRRRAGSARRASPTRSRSDPARVEAHLAPPRSVPPERLRRPEHGLLRRRGVRVRRAGRRRAEPLALVLVSSAGGELAVSHPRVLVSRASGRRRRSCRSSRARAATSRTA